MGEMQFKSDARLLCEYAENGAEAPFDELVERYAGLVYSAALRQVESPAAAAEIAQNVFVGLARNARSVSGRLAPEASLAGWLCRSARNLSLNLRRDEFRRRARERQLMEEILSVPENPPDWERVRGVLDEAMADLDEADYDAVVLRFYQNRDYRAVGAVLGVSDDTAQKRVARALEKLRESLSRRGIRATSAVLSAVLVANAVQSAPAGLAAGISAAVAAGAAVSTSTAIAVTQIIAMTTLQKTLIAVTIAALAGAGIYETHQANTYRTQYEALRQAQSDRTSQPERERDQAGSGLAGTPAGSARPSANSNELELLKLRAEVAALRGVAEDPGEKAMRGAAAKVKTLRQLLAERPDKQIPELKFLTDKKWAEVAWNADLSTEDGIREALSNLRGEAVNRFLNEMMKDAMKKYLAANGNVLPDNLTKLEPYFDEPVTDEMLGHYELLQSGTPDKSADLVRLTAHADPDYDSNHGMSINGAWGGGYNRNHDAIWGAVRNYYLANGGQAPTDPSQLTPYLDRTMDAGTVQKYLSQISTDIAANPPSADELTLWSVVQAFRAANPNQTPMNPSNLAPYATTPAQQAALQRVMQKEGGGK
jgi:RNA polymerase sigma factor (sigma-70 family)